MYKIKCYNSRSRKEENVIIEQCDNDFNNIIEAKNQLLIHAMNRLETTNMQNVSSRPFIFIPKTNHRKDGRLYDVAIFARFCNTPDEFMHGYYIEWVNNDDVDKFNRKLRDEFGEDITLRLYETDQCGDPEYYFMGVTTNGESEYYDDVEDAYNAARSYMQNILN